MAVGDELLDIWTKTSGSEFKLCLGLQVGTDAPLSNNWFESEGITVTQTCHQS